MKKLILIFLVLMASSHARSQDIFGTSKDPQEYIAIVTQSGTNPPVSNVLKNTTIYNFTWERHVAGQYFLIPKLGERADITTTGGCLLEWTAALVDSTGLTGYLVTDQLPISSEYPDANIFPFSTLNKTQTSYEDNLIRGRGAIIKIKFYRP